MSEHKSSEIVVIGAYEHNLKHVNIRIPRDTLTVFTGVSGSGKSSLAFDTIFKEGQRRFVESLSPYARQFLGQTDKPRVEHVEGLSPTISVDQKTVNRNPRSTVGTITEIYDHYRLLFARVGEPHCPQCGERITSQTPAQITDHVYADARDQACMVLAPMVQERKGEYRKELQDWLAEGYIRARIDGQLRRLDEEITLARYEKHSIDLVLDRMTLTDDEKSRFVEALEKALRLAKGLVIVNYAEKDHLFSQLMACPKCQISLPEMEPRLFSFNAPQGSCPTCIGLGVLNTFHEEKLCDPEKSIEQRSLQCFTERGNILFTKIEMEHIERMLEVFGIPGNVPWKLLSGEHRNLILHGNASFALGISNVFRYPESLMSKLNKKQWPGIIPILQFVYKFVKGPLEKFQHTSGCPDCEGKRLNKMALAVKFHGHSIHSLTGLPIEESLRFFSTLPLTPREQTIGRDIFREIRDRLLFLNEVGVGYLSLDRSAATLSGGEGQRIRLASQLGSGLQGVLYVLDEPSIGLHQSDNQKLIHTLKMLRDRGNTVLVVEHDEETIAAADHVVDIGPTAGSLGGYIIAQGTLKDIIQSPSMTGKFLSGAENIVIPAQRRQPSKMVLTVHKAEFHNLKQITVEIPLGLFVAIAGVSGSGKSSLVDGILKKALSRQLHRSQDVPGAHEKITGIEHIDKVIEIDQSPIGRTPRSNPATYTKVFDEIRNLFTSVPESRARGYKSGRFSFNVKGGRCEDCEGAGIQTIEMQFLSDVQIPCDTCRGKRFNTETLQIFFKGKNIHEVLEMTVEEGADFFQAIPKISNILRVLKEVGLGYIHLGQPSTTLSGGEAQRVKLASELRKKATGKTLYILDEPTTGLHFQDIRLLLQCLNQLVEQGNTVLVIEHNLDVLKTADYVIELGPGGGKYGGELVACGTPEQLALKESLTGKFLKPTLKLEKPWLTDKSHTTSGSRNAATELSQERNIVIKGASKNNLRHVSLEIPVNQMTVITGVSGSGKTSLAFDTIFAEGQARYVESLSTYARRFLGRMDKAPVDSIDGLAPAIAINQKSTSRNPRSTVATTTEIYDYLRLLFARIGEPHCPHCGQPLKGYTPTRVAQAWLQLFPDERLEILAPLYRPGSKKITLLDEASHLKQVVDHLKHDGFARVYVKDQLIRLDEWDTTHKNLVLKKKDNVDLVVDRIHVSEIEQKRLAESAEVAFQKGHGILKVRRADHANQEVFFSEKPGCVACDFYLEEELTPRMFSFNSHVGACPACDGLGQMEDETTCPTCLGQRLKPEYLAVRVNGKNISEFCAMNVRMAQAEINLWKLSDNQTIVAEQALKEVTGRLDFLDNVGLTYLTLDQRTATLSGGEAQRIRLASQIGSGLVGVMYVLDEPTIGLHSRDTDRLLSTLHKLRDLGNTVILVEHDLDTIRSANHVVDIGPGAGHYGGQVVASGTVPEIMKNENSLTGQYLNGIKTINVPTKRRSFSEDVCLKVHGAEENNLKNIDVSFPIGVFTVVTGVSGSGKSSLVIDILQKTIQKKLNKTRQPVGKHQKLSGVEHIDKLMVIDQDPIGKSPRSNPASYSNVLAPIRELFAEMPEAKKRGFTKRRFSFNAVEGRCPACEGQGHVLIEMHFLSDVWVQCDECKGQRYNRETLSVTFKGHTMADVLNMEVNQAVELFDHQPRILRICKTLQDVGLGYIKLGQPGNTLSGGESQRLKLSAELAKRATGKTLYILDEPTTGLHIDDTARLLKVLHHLVDAGNTVIVIEHNLDVVKTADYVIDLGPEGGENGGQLVFTGTPEEIKNCETSHTGRFLRPFLMV
ncbi:MAG: excinuclease ABC subunit UvrA [SAR324 cluster bacterium]|nr:excinuclease ABC subunit UvrA [SAR324 cluster bacterium]